MKMTFRWYGGADSIPLEYISQIPMMTGVVTAVYDVAPGGLWSNESISALRRAAESHSLEMEVIESVPVHEDIKLGKPSRDKYIEIYAENIRRLGANGVKVVCYNFMPVFDWLRSQLDYKNADGSTSLIYRHSQVLKMNPMNNELSLPGWDSSYTHEGMRALLDEYSAIDEDKLFDNLKYFLDGIIPACEESGIKMAIHPDDPPWGIFGLPRIVTNEKNIDRLLALNNSECNGLTICTGSLGASRDNDVNALLGKYLNMGRVHFVHVRNILLTGENDFNETAHPTSYGSLDIYAIMKTLYDANFKGYVRPDHGRMIFGETGKPGYGLYDRALGAVYLSGLWEAISRR